MTSAGKLTAGIYDMSHNVTSYFNLRETNEELQLQNARLEEELLSMKAELQQYQERYHADTMTVFEPVRPYKFIIASVINNSIYRPYNHITINKGSKDGLRPEMGVIDQNGIVGVVNVVGENYSRLISLLNPNFRLSCKVKGNEAFGSLVWDGKDPQMALLEEYKVDFIVLARYMQIISEKMIEAYPNRIINIHHSFLPAFVGAKPYHAAYERGVKIIGATSHYVTTELDAGPIIEQDVTKVTHKDTVKDLIHKGQDLEKIVLSKGVEKHLEHKVLVYHNKTIVF